VISHNAVCKNPFAKTRLQKPVCKNPFAKTLPLEFFGVADGAARVLEKVPRLDIHRLILEMQTLFSRSTERRDNSDDGRENYRPRVFNRCQSSASVILSFIWPPAFPHGCTSAQS
jgi:hypothetical protein